MAQGEEQTRLAQNELNSIENSIKVYKGQLAGLKDKNLMAKKLKAEQALRASVNADARKKQEYGDAWDAIAKAHKDYAGYARERRLLDLGDAFNSVLFGYARTLVRLADENEKPNTQRLTEFTDARRASLELVSIRPHLLTKVSRNLSWQTPWSSCRASTARINPWSKEY